MPNQPERCCNKLVNARIRKKKLKTLRNRLKAVTKSVDNTSPRSFGLPHLKRNLKKAKMLEDQYKTIEHQNRTLLQRMSNIMENPSKTTDNHMKAYGRWSRSLNLQRRRENLDRITCDNGHLLARLQKMEPYYKVDDWERDFQRSEKIMRHMMEFDYVGPAGGEPDAGAVPVAAGASMQQLPQARSPSKTKKAASPNKGRGASPRRGAGTSPRRRGRGGSGGGGGAAASPKQRRLKKLPRKVRERVPVPVSDEVVEIFRFPSLAVRGLGVPDSAWDISLFDSRARGDGNGGGGDDHDDDGHEGGGAAGTEAAATTVLVLRGNKVTRTAVTTLALDDDALDRVVAQSSALQAVFDSVRGGMRAYRALGLVRGDTQLTTQLANLLLGRLRVTPELQFTLVFEDGEGDDEGGGRSNDDSDDDDSDDDDGDDGGDAVDVEVGAEAEQEEGAGKPEEAKAEEAMEKEERKEEEEEEEEAAALSEPANAGDVDADVAAGEPDASGKAPPNGGAEGGGDAEGSGAEQADGSDGVDAAAASP